ncbi:MAG: RagB/SusD family nutrient uptake outer membrane protein [Saprospiraceae bacterium]|nr:RagB/SusD family nutrient uptake outer membrane protein [Saprospiraceae bacterium]
MKKSIYKFTALFAILFMVSACEKEFLDTYPTTAVSDSDVLLSTQNAIAALNGIHRSLYQQFPVLGSQGQGGEGSNNIFRDLIGEDLILPLAGGSTFHFGFVRWQTHRNVNAGDLRYMYHFYYRIIGNANVLINGIEKTPGSEADKNMIRGQALAYRGWAHFQLVQLWGERYDASKTNTQLGVPLMIENTLAGQPRATVEEVYTQINKDLDEAITLLAGYTRTGSAAKSNINVNVAQGFKARVALTQQNWAAAATAAAAARAGHALMSNAQYTSGFNDITNPEWIWGSRQISDHNTFFWSYFAYISANFNSTVIRTQPRAINGLLWEQISDTDVRKLMWDRTGANVPIPPGGARVPYQNNKFLAASSSLSIGDVPLMRSGEMLLIEAEAKARNNDEDGARQALFTLVSNRDPQYVLSTNSGQALIDEILFNRRIELWGEGFRFTDLKRLNLPLNRNGIPNQLLVIVSITDVPAGDKQWQWIFPQDEINANPAIVQNPL